MFYTQSTAKGHIRVKQSVFLPQVNILIHYLIENNTQPTVQDWRNLWKTKLNELGRQQLGRYRSPGTAGKTIVEPTTDLGGNL